MFSHLQICKVIAEAWFGSPEPWFKSSQIGQCCLGMCAVCLGFNVLCYCLKDVWTCPKFTFSKKIFLDMCVGVIIRSTNSFLEGELFNFCQNKPCYKEALATEGQFFSWFHVFGPFWCQKRPESMCCIMFFHVLQLLLAEKWSIARCSCSYFCDSWWFFMSSLGCVCCVCAAFLCSSSCSCASACSWLMFLLLPLLSVLLLLLFLLLLLLLLLCLGCGSVIVGGLTWAGLVVFGLPICHVLAAPPVSFELCLFEKSQFWQVSMSGLLSVWVPLVDAHYSWHSLDSKQRL